MIIPDGLKLLFDLETTGLLPYMQEHLGDDVKSRVHILAIRDLDTGQLHVFRKNKKQDSIARGIELLNQADVIVGHNIIGFDIPVLEMLYPDICNFQGLIRDTLVISRVFFADEKERDFKRWRRGELEGKEIGRHGLEAWGQRLGLHKGDYSKAKMEELKQLHPELAKTSEGKQELMRMVWAKWSQDMEDYCIQDLVVNEALWALIQHNAHRHSDKSVQLEHQVHYLMEQVTNNGFPFDMESALVMEKELREVVAVKEAEAVNHFGSWWVPSKWKTVGKEYSVEVTDDEGNPIKDDNGKVLKQKVEFRPRAEFGEQDLEYNADGTPKPPRLNWGDVVMPKKTMRFKPESGKPDREAGCPYCPVELKEFNPGSREQIIDRLVKVYGWEPQEFTETGKPAVNDEVLRGLAVEIPICEQLAELFYYNKRLGQLVDGKNGWIGKSMERGDCKVHPRFNVGGAVTNRATHSDPNIAQVPRVVSKAVLQWVEEDIRYGFVNGEITYWTVRTDENGTPYECDQLTPLLGPDGKQIKGMPVRAKKEKAYDENGELLPGYCHIEGREGAYVLDDEGNLKTKKQVLYGRAGDHGADCRQLFIVPDGWVLMGADQAGIELRALAHFMAEFDDGEYGQIVLSGDPHQYNADAIEVSRDTAKTVIYALIYGAQDYKLGITVNPALFNRPQEAKRVGGEIRKRLMTRIPALGQVIKAIQRQAKSGMLDALDGRKLFVRAQHAALNTLLQGAGATIAKQWCVNFWEYCEEDGLVHGWDGDFAILAWIHDELQVAVRDDPAVIEICQRNIETAAYDAGKEFGFRMPVDVDVKFGKNWMQTH